MVSGVRSTHGADDVTYGLCSNVARLRPKLNRRDTKERWVAVYPGTGTRSRSHRVPGYPGYLGTMT
eukprot:3121434-Rhodomonas_salina.2